MSQQRPSQKPASAEKSKPEQPRSTELSPKELDKVGGGLSDIQVTKVVDKSSTKLF